MKTILDRMLAALAAGERTVLCSIFASSGSSPRGAGAKMAVFADGSSLGTVGGGAVELEAIRQAQSVLAQGEGLLRAFSLRPDQVASVGMICGGAVEIYFQLFTPENAAGTAVLRHWREVLDKGENAWLYMLLDGGAVRKFAVYTASELPAEKKEYFTAKTVWKNGIYTESICRAGKVYIFGGGHVGKALVPVLHYVGFTVVVYDDRPALAVQENYPAAAEVICGSFADIFAQVRLTADDYAVIMTPGHQADYEVLRQVLGTQATYIGCIGSHRKVEMTRERLLADGFTPAQLDTVHSPIGLAIKAETPEEIAISIAAEMIAHRANHL